MDNKSQSSFHSFGYDEDDLEHDPFVQKPGKITKNSTMINPFWSGILSNRFLITEQSQLRDLHKDLKSEQENI